MCLMRITYNPNLRPLARKLRKEGTLAEVLLWQQLKGRKIRGYPCTRQKPIGNYIVDFYSSRLRVAIEVDGVSQDERLQQDKMRQKEIEKQGVRVLRFYDSDVKTNLDGVLLVIADWVRKKEKQQGVRPYDEFWQKDARDTPLWSPLDRGDLGSGMTSRGTPPCGPPLIGGTWEAASSRKGHPPVVPP